MEDKLSLLLNFLIASGLLGAFSKLISALYKKYLENKMITGIKQYSESMKIIRDLRNTTSLNRVLIASGHNGGGIPGPFNKPKITIIDESYDSDIYEIKSSIQGIEASQFHCDNILLPLIDGKSPSFNIEDLDEKERDMHIVNKHYSSKVFLIAKNPTCVIYLGVFTQSDINVLPLEDKEKIRVAISKLVKIYKR